MKSIIYKVIALVVLILILGGMLNWTKKPVKEDSTAVVDKTAEWKTYTNTQLGYEIQYPANWKIDQNTGGLDTSITIYNPEKEESASIDVLKGVPCVESDWKSNIDGIQTGVACIAATRDGMASKFGTIKIVTVASSNDGMIIGEKIINTLKFTTPSNLPTCENGATNPPHCNADLPMAVPHIDSMTPTSGLIGTIITIKGTNFAGFEGDLDAWIENSNGEVGFLPGIGSVPRADQDIKVKIESKVCKTNNGYSGKPCDSYLTITPGVYKIYTAPYGVKSNEVEFTVIK